MAHKTFISYKYDEARDVRDRIIDSLGDDASYYNGETSDSPDMTDDTTDSIKEYLKDMLYNTSVTIVVISPHMKDSAWIDWEIEYSLKRVTRKNRTSQTNGVVGVIMKYDGGYDWIKNTHKNSDGCVSSSYNADYLYPIIKENRFNQTPKVYTCQECKTVDALTGSYIAFVEEEKFLDNPSKYIDNAYNKSENDGDGYDLCRQR